MAKVEGSNPSGPTTIQLGIGAERLRHLVLSQDFVGSSPTSPTNKPVDSCVVYVAHNNDLSTMRLDALSFGVLANS